MKEDLGLILKEWGLGQTGVEGFAVPVIHPLECLAKNDTNDQASELSWEGHWEKSEQQGNRISYGRFEGKKSSIKIVSLIMASLGPGP